MIQAFPLLAAALEGAPTDLSPGEDVGRVLDMLGVAGARYHAFEPVAPVAPSVPARIPPAPTLTVTESLALVRSVGWPQAEATDAAAAPVREAEATAGAPPVHVDASVADAPAWRPQGFAEAAPDRQVAPARSRDRLDDGSAEERRVADAMQTDSRRNARRTRGEAAAGPDSPGRRSISLVEMFRMLDGGETAPRSLRDVFG